MGVRLRHLARMTAIFNPFSEAVANIGDHCGWCASMSGHGPSWHWCVGCSQPVHRSTLVDATGARTHMAKLSWHDDFVVSVVCRRTQRPSSGSGEAPWISSRMCHWKVQIFCERIHSVSREPECSRSQIFTSGFSFAAPGDMVCVYMLDGTGLACMSPLKQLWLASLCWRDSVVGKSMGVRLRHLARMTAIFNPFSEAVANIGDHCGWCASMSGHGPSWHWCVGCSQPVHRSTLVDATGARTHMAKLSWHDDFVVSVVCRRTQRPSSGSGEAPWVSSRVCHWKVQIFCERIHSVSREPECSRSQIFTSGFSFAAPGDMVCVYMLDGTGLACMSPLKQLWLASLCWRDSVVGKSMGVRLRHLARMTAIFNPFSEAVANIGDHCGWCASMSGHGPSWHWCVGCSQPVHRSTLVDATGARTHMAKLSWHDDFVVSVVCRRTQRPSSGSGEAPWVSSRVCHWNVQIFCERIHSVSREPECSRSQIFTSGFSFAAPGDMVCVYMLDGTGLACMSPLKHLWLASLCWRDSVVGKSMGVRLRHLARMTAIFNPFSEAVANIGDHCRWCASMSGHGPSWHWCVGCSQPVHRSTLVDATGARTHMAKLSWHDDFVVSVVCRRTQRPSSGSGEAPWVSSRVCHWKVQIFCERIHSVSREPECSRP